jgi:hypothetical protein
MEGDTLHMARKGRVRILATVLTGVLASLCCYSLRALPDTRRLGAGQCDPICTEGRDL